MVNLSAQDEIQICMGLPKPTQLLWNLILLIDVVHLIRAWVIQIVLHTLHVLQAQPLCSSLLLINILFCLDIFLCRMAASSQSSPLPTSRDMLNSSTCSHLISPDWVRDSCAKFSSPWNAKQCLDLPGQARKQCFD